LADSQSFKLKKQDFVISRYKISVLEITGLVEITHSNWGKRISNNTFANILKYIQLFKIAGAKVFYKL
jgi:hypothetical protein